MSETDPYKVLQVDPEAEDEVIEAAYRRLARKYHPDVSAGPDTELRMVRINQAWEVLRDPVKRAAHDRGRTRAAAAATGRPRETEDPGHGTPPIVPDVAPPPPRPQAVSRDWTSGRSSAGGGYDPATMRHPDGTGAAGPPPGRPSGSVLGFGRYAGWSLGEIARADLEYLEWLDRMPIGRIYRDEIDRLLRAGGRRRSAPAEAQERRGLFRRR